MDKRRIWIFNHYATDTYFDRGGRHYSFAKYLKKAGHDVRIFCASTVHNSDVNIDTQGSSCIEGTVDGIPYTFLKVPAYSGNGLSRIMNMYLYYRKLFGVYKKYINRGDIPDIIVASSVHPLALVAGIKVAKKLNVPCICEIRDIWPETLVAYNIISENNPLTKLLFVGKKWVYKRADAIIYTMPDGVQCIKDKGWEDSINLSKVYNINNGVDLEEFKANIEENYYEDVALDDDKIKLVYTGSIREANCIDFLLELADAIKNDTRFRIIVYGDGDKLQSLREEKEKRDLQNILFRGRVEKKFIPSILVRGDANLMIGSEGLAVAKYGLSLNKMIEYMASGKPILTNFREGETKIIGNPERPVGIISSIDSADEFAKAVIELFNDEALYNQLSENAATVSSEFAFDKLTDKLLAVVENCLSERQA